ncbi:52 kDa repressor of the inhibitor of the protein kinase-like [Salvelinus namaycush]|uniref:52 kDa repressor of the inhibitor of the protein kinase-like n=1 Tax=Salvelinus namaycush TaxID=8040 RepID=A0A8U1EPH8_SALNM|nr:52 kDa repressor of the inhibitor of the protein kinase-like [Salvelinus namaycush]
MSNFCAAPNCTIRSNESASPFFRFPRDTERCKQWVDNCHCKDLEDKTPDQLNRHYRLCVNHFEPSMICKASPYRTKLKDNATPTIFDLTSHLNNPQCRQRKRIKELSNAEARQMKERKKDSVDQSKTNKNYAEGQVDPETNDTTQLTSKEKEHREYLKSLFEVIVVLGKQNIPLNRHTKEVPESKCLTPSNFKALLEYRMNAGGDEALRKRFEMSAMNKECCTFTQQMQMMEVCESCIREELLQEVREVRFFSLVTDDVVEISGESHLPMFLRFLDQANCLREEFVGFLPFEGEDETLMERLLTEVTKKWGLNMDYCRGQAHFSSGVHSSKMKAIATKLTEMYPTAVYTPRSTCALNASLASGVALTGVQIVMSTFKKIESFFNEASSLQLELENAISIFYQGNEEKANDLKEACRTNWTVRHDAFEVAVDVLESLLLCMDSVHDNEDLRWSDQVTNDALEISEALADFEFVATLVVLKNTLSFTRAFGKNLQGPTMDVYFAANSLTAVLHSLNEVSDNIDVYHEFWFEEAVNLAAALEIPVKVPRLYLRKHHAESGTEIQPESYFKEHLTAPVVSHVINELNDLFSENHLNALRCLTLVPAVMGQLKFNTSEENNVEMYRNDLPNADTLPTELHCWRVKWKHRGKVTLPSTVHETLQLAEVKFFPNVLAFLRVLCNLPVLSLDVDGDASRKRFQMYLENTPDKHRSKSLAFLNIHYNARHDLDVMVDSYIKMYPENESHEQVCQPVD